MKFKKEFLTPVSDKKYLKLKKMFFRNKVSRYFFYKYINENEGGQFYSLRAGPGWFYQKQAIR